MSQKFHAIILAAGSGQRFGSDTPKQYCPLAGKTVLYHSVQKFISHPLSGSVRVIIDPDHINLYQNSITGLDLADFVAGGKTRKESVFNGLKSLFCLKDNDIILIHDGARPLVSHADIDGILGALKIAKSATTAISVTDTLYRDGDDYVPRDGLHRLLTPQGFHYGTIMQAHEKGADMNATDDSALVKSLGIAPILVQSSPANFKITHQDDLSMAEALMSQQRIIRTGSGFDVHAFEEAPSSRKLMLCGVEIPHPHALAGHSDADVGLHALTDALLGALGAGDIGDHFPPSDNQYKDMDSAIFLQKTIDMLTARGGIICNLDVTLICEEPKMGPHKKVMRRRIAEICDIDADLINIKATTTEKLGFAGRGEGIAAQAIATIEVQK